MSMTREEQLRQRAYRIWESEGRPDGMEAEHWARAERELAAEEPEPAAAPPARSRRKPSMVEKAVGAISRATAKKKADTSAPKTSRSKKKD